MDKTTMTDFIVETVQLDREFGTTAALKNVDLQINAGTIVGIVGPNGAGKTTLLHLLAGLLEPTHGSCSVLGHIARQLPGSLAPEVVCVGDRNEPPGWYSIGDLLVLQADTSERFDLLFARQLLAERNLAEKARWSGLSKGLRRWVLATLAIAARPRLLLMDEPADGLDPHARLSLYDHLRELVNDHDSTVLVSSHVLGDLQRVVDDLVVMKNGRVLISESLDTLRDQIREVELPARLDAVPQDEDITVLARSNRDDVEHLWLRSANRQMIEQLETRVDIRCRTVNLESLYLAITDRESGIGQQDPSHTEVASC